jgi:GNAT superfamily N-acetyltransferase
VRPPTFRAAEPANVDLLLAYVREFYALDAIGIHFDESVVRRRLTELLQDPRLGRAWIIRDSEEPIGYLVLTFGYSLEYGRDAMLDELFIRPSHRGKGVGTAAMLFLEATCRDLGIRAVHLEVSHQNDAARRLYTRAGFAVHGTDFMTRWIARG